MREKGRTINRLVYATTTLHLNTSLNKQQIVSQSSWCWLGPVECKSHLRKQESLALTNMVALPSAQAPETKQFEYRCWWRQLSLHPLSASGHRKIRAKWQSLGPGTQEYEDARSWTSKWWQPVVEMTFRRRYGVMSTSIYGLFLTGWGPERERRLSLFLCDRFSACVSTWQITIAATINRVPVFQSYEVGSARL